MIRFSFLGLLVGLAALTPSFLFFSIPLKGVRDIENGGWLTFLVLTVAVFVSVPIGWLATNHRRDAGSYPRFIRSRLILLVCTGGAAFIIAVFVFYAGHFWRQHALMFFLAPPIAATIVVGLSAFRHDYARSISPSDTSRRNC